MGLIYNTIEQFDIGEHEFRQLLPNETINWLRVVADEYKELRTQTAAIDELSLEGIPLASEAIRRRVKAATIPNQTIGNFDVVRSDFGETICYMLLEQLYETKFIYKSVRDRELADRAGRGIDAIGIEEGEKLSLILAEVKVSNENTSPPQVIDTGSTCLRQQHKKRIDDLQATADAVLDVARRTSEMSIRGRFTMAALCLEYQQWHLLNLVVACVLLRPLGMFTNQDFGSYRAKPEQFTPAKIRFLVACVPYDDIGPIIERWYKDYVLPPEANENE